MLHIQNELDVKVGYSDHTMGIEVPIAITGPKSHGWWALNTLMVVIGMIGFMAVFAYLYLYGINPEVWSAPPPLGETAIIVGIEAAALLAAWGGRRFLASKEGRLAEDLLPPLRPPALLPLLLARVLQVLGEAQLAARLLLHLGPG